LAALLSLLTTLLWWLAALLSLLTTLLGPLIRRSAPLWLVVLLGAAPLWPVVSWLCLPWRWAVLPVRWRWAVLPVRWRWVVLLLVSAGAPTLWFAPVALVVRRLFPFRHHQLCVQCTG